MGELEDLKLKAEIERLQAETEGLRPSRFDLISKWLKLIGAGIIGGGGLLSAVTTYQITEARTAAADARLELATFKQDAAEADLLRVRQSRDEAQQAAAQAEQAVRDNRHQLEELQAELTNAKSSLERVRMELEKIQRVATAKINGTSPAAVALATEAVATAAQQQGRLENAVKAAIVRAKQDESPTVDPMVLIFSPSGASLEAAHVAEVLGANHFLLGKKKVFQGRSPDGPTEVRYFRHPEDRQDAESILTLLKTKAGLANGRISYVQDPDIKRPRYFEVRLAPNAFSQKTDPGAQPPP